MDQDTLKKLVGQAALNFVEPNSIIGVGTGSTVNKFIEALGESSISIQGAVSSSVASTQLLQKIGIAIFEPHEVSSLNIYIDGADEIDPKGCMLKGGGGALTREKIVADLAESFICIADQSKKVQVLGAFALPVEIIPMAASQLSRLFESIGGKAKLRRMADGRAFVTDNGLHILDVHGLQITSPLALEQEISAWPGVVTAGIFARNRAKVCLLGTGEGVQTLHFD